MELTTANKDFDAPLLAALGLLHPDLTSFKLFMLAGAVIQDNTVQVRKLNGTIDTLEVVEQMTDTEREEIADRIRAKFPKWF